MKQNRPPLLTGKSGHSFQTAGEGAGAATVHGIEAAVRSGVTLSSDRRAIIALEAARREAGEL